MLFGFGKLNKNLCVLLSAVLFKILGDIVYGINYPKNNKYKSLYIYSSIIKDNLMLLSHPVIF